MVCENTIPNLARDIGAYNANSIMFLGVAGSIYLIYFIAKIAGSVSLLI